MTTHLQPASCGTIDSVYTPVNGDQGPLEVLVARAVGHLTILKAWHDRSRQRRQLSQLDDRMLDDIGVSRTAAVREAAKQPWVA